MTDFLRIDNDGPRIVASNFWDLPEMTERYLISLNAGAVRLLLPDALTDSIPTRVVRSPVPSGRADRRSLWNDPATTVASPASRGFVHAEEPRP